MLTPIPPFSSLYDPNNTKASNDFIPLANTNIDTNPSFKSRRQDSFERFNAILQNAFQRSQKNLSRNSQPSINPPKVNIEKTSDLPNEKSSRVQQSSNAILGFIDRRLKSDEANGANQEALLERLNQGLQGFIKGFNEAKDQLDDMGLLTPQLSDEINETYQQVTQGIEQLKNKIIGVTSNPDPTELNDATNTTQLNQVSHVEAQASQSSSFSLSLTTQDGDRVNIEISRSNQFSLSNDSSSNGNRASSSTIQHSSSSHSFQLNVTGELDDDELTAINQLLQDIDSIANDFYSGRYDDAFEQALELEIDHSQLNSLDLQLQQTTTVKALAAYQTSSAGDLLTPNSSAISELNQLLNSLEQIMEDVKKLSQPLQLINDLTRGIDQLQQENTSSKISFSEQLNKLISQFNL